MESKIDSINELVIAINKYSSVNISEWILIGITTVYVIATILICIFNYRSAKATREQVLEQKRQFDEINRPNIDIVVEIVRKGIICLRIENTGKRLAQNIKMNICDEFINQLKLINERNTFNLLANSIFRLGIGQIWYLYICLSEELTQLSNVLLKIDIFYKDYKQQAYNEYTVIDLNQYSWALLYNSPLDDISGYQEKIVDIMNRNK